MIAVIVPLCNTAARVPLEARGRDMLKENLRQSQKGSGYVLPRTASNGMKKIILASASPRRKEILKKLRLPFTTEESGYEEDLGLKLKPRSLAKHLALMKAEAVARRRKNAIVIGADTIVVLKGKVLGKPKNASDARKMLSQLSGNIHTVITGFAIIDVKTGEKVSKAVETRVYFRELDKREISDYMKTGEPQGKAGAYAIQGFGAVLIKKIEGDYYNVVGLPLSALREELNRILE